MESAKRFVEKIRRGGVCVGTGITFTDATATEALCDLFDFVWIDMEHNALSLEAVQAHLIATKGTRTLPLVRVRSNDPVLIKTVLDIGAPGIIVPMVRTVQEATLAVQACRYPPQGFRGIGPRRASNYGRSLDSDFFRRANEEILVMVQIEHRDAVENLDGILAVAGLSGIAIGRADLSASMGLTGQWDHPEIVQVVESVVRKARQTNLLVGMGGGDDPEVAGEWVRKGVQWIQMGGDFSLMLRGASQVLERMEQHVLQREK
ncbi:MAG: 4-hydroxy-3-methylbut-2-en-1-yl diphosphate synthase [Acidobacteria bacterium]|nr:4-hydroxy-3-methylbut-2-en-1-yl diphosphate synthase [Acidobacteriota bacterium]